MPSLIDSFLTGLLNAKASSETYSSASSSSSSSQQQPRLISIITDNAAGSGHYCRPDPRARPSAPPLPLSAASDSGIVLDEDDSASPPPRWQAAISNDDCRPSIPSRKRCLPKLLREAQDGFDQFKVILQELEHSSSIDATTETASKMIENQHAGGHQNEQSRTKSCTDGPPPTICLEASHDSCLERNGRCPAA
jgi:hypothetical protein